MSFTWLGLLLAVYIILLAAAALQDIATLKISNLFSVALLAVGIAAVALDAGPGWWQHLASFAIVLFAGLLLYAVGWMGAGDAKLFAATAVAFNLTGLLKAVVFALLAGGIIAFGLIVFAFLRWRATPRSKRMYVPYGLAIAIGAVLAIWLDPPASAFF